MRFFYLSTIILFVLSQGACNLFPTKMNTISKGNERNKRKRINKKPPYLSSPKSKQPRTKSRKRKSIIREKKRKKANK